MSLSGHTDDADRVVLLVEYEKAQDSAEHHDELVGSSTSLLLASAVLLGFVLTALTSPNPARYRTVLIMVTVLGMLLNGLVLSWIPRALKIKNGKYERCKEIESVLGMEQHRKVQPGRRWQPFGYYILIGISLATWVVLFAKVVRL